MERSFEILSKDPPDADLAMLAHQLGRIQHFVGEHELAGERVEFALEIAEGLRLTEVIAQALNTKAIVLGGQRPHEATALLEHALVVALEGDHAPAAFRTYFNRRTSACRVTASIRRSSTFAMVWRSPAGGVTGTGP